MWMIGRALEVRDLLPGTLLVIIHSEGGCDTVSGYPPNIPGRDHYTWCRVMQHVQVLMLSDSPEFLEEMMQLDHSIRAHIASANVSELIVKQGLEELEEAREQILEQRKSKKYWDKLRNVLTNRADLQNAKEMGLEVCASLVRRTLMLRSEEGCCLRMVTDIR